MSAPVQSCQPTIVERLRSRSAAHHKASLGSWMGLGYYSSYDAQVMSDAADRIQELERDLAETEREVDAFSTISPLQYQKEAATLKARAEQAERAVDVLESNARVQAKLLADTGRRVEGMEAALRECVDVLAMAERPALVDPDYGDEVAALGDRIGYGALMSSASASWRERLEKEDCPTGGEFVAGPCHATVVRTLKLIRAALSSVEADYRASSLDIIKVGTVEADKDLI